MRRRVRRSGAASGVINILGVLNDLPLPARQEHRHSTHLCRPLEYLLSRRRRPAQRRRLRLLLLEPRCFAGLLAGAHSHFLQASRSCSPPARTCAGTRSVVPENCVAAETAEASRQVLAQMGETLKGTTCRSTALRLHELAALPA